MSRSSAYEAMQAMKGQLDSDLLRAFRPVAHHH
jgi:hypothetical protein